MSKPFGRPTKYNDEMQATADRYITEYKEFGDVVPTLAGLACFCDVDRDTVHTWIKKYPEFSDTAKRVMSLQERMLVNGGLSKVNDSSITKLLLASNHGYSDKISQDHTTNGKDIGADSNAVLMAIKAKHEPNS